MVNYNLIKQLKQGSINKFVHFDLKKKQRKCTNKQLNNENNESTCKRNSSIRYPTVPIWIYHLADDEPLLIQT